MARKKQRQPNVVAFVLLGIVALGLVALLVSSAGGDDDDGAAEGVTETRDVDVSGGGDLVVFADQQADPAVGTPAPVLTGESFAGEPITIPSEGPAVVMFVAHWCPHCQREVPFVVDWLEANGQPEGVDLFGVSTAVESNAANYPPSEWLEREGWDIPTLVDAEDGGAASAYGLSAFPFFVAVNAEGDVVARASGELDAPSLEALIDAARTR